MNNDDLDIKPEKPGKLESYITGFIVSLILTLGSYFLVSENLVRGSSLGLTVGALAFFQIMIQLVFFLHLGEEPSPRWNLIAFFFMVLMVLIIVVGTIWIMNNLNYQMTLDVA